MSFRRLVGACVCLGVTDKGLIRAGRDYRGHSRVAQVCSQKMEPNMLRENCIQKGRLLYSMISDIYLSFPNKNNGNHLYLYILFIINNLIISIMSIIIIMSLFSIQVLLLYACERYENTKRITNKSSCIVILISEMFCISRITLKDFQVLQMYSYNQRRSNLQFEFTGLIFSFCKTLVVSCNSSYTLP